MAELILFRPLFTGNDYVHQLKCIIALIGTPSPEDMAQIPPKAREFVQSLGYIPRTPLAQIFPNTSAVCLHLLERMLTLDPAKRISVEESLAHPFFAQLHNPAEEPVCAVPFTFDFERLATTAEMFRELAFSEVLELHPELRQQ